jgi:NAD(P)-dependent dehydrogenase (short-subunit alcohol dehydrogenase family)
MGMKELTLTGRVALVTGAGVRIGAAIARALAARGAGVAIHCRRSTAAAARLAREIRGAGGRAWVVRGALDTEAGCAQVVRAARRAAGRMDILVNSAAVFHRDPLAAITERKLLAEFRVNLFAPLLLARYFVRQGRGGSIVNIVDRRVAGTDPACLPYWLTKRGLADATRALARELAPAYTVNAVAPGPTLPPPGRPASHLREKAGPIPLGRPVPPEAVAEAVARLIEAEGVTGQILYVDGGQHLVM